MSKTATMNKTLIARFKIDGNYRVPMGEGVLIDIDTVTAWRVIRWIGDNRKLVAVVTPEGCFVVYKSDQSKAVVKIMKEAVKGMMTRTI